MPSPVSELAYLPSRSAAAGVLLARLSSGVLRRWAVAVGKRVGVGDAPAMLVSMDENSQAGLPSA